MAIKRNTDKATCRDGERADFEQMRGSLKDVLMSLGQIVEIFNA